MSILINSYAGTGVLLYSAALLSFSKDEQISSQKALAVDGIRLSFLVLDEASHRLNECLTKISDGSLSEKDGMAYYVRIDHILGYVWTIIDHSKRVLRFIEIIELTFDNESNNGIADTVKLLTKARDSFQHLNERIQQYYTDNRGSLNGDLLWYFREADSSAVTSCYLSSSAAPRPAQEVDGVRMISTQPVIIEAKEDREMGISDLSLHFIKSENRQKGPFTYSVVSIDEIAQLMNDIIIILLRTFSKHVESSIGVKGRGSLPFLSKIEISRNE
jgi:hypothetical protein